MNLTNDQQPAHRPDEKNSSTPGQPVMSPEASVGRDSVANTSVLQESIAAGESIVVPIIEEQVQIGKRVVETGKVRIVKKVHEEAVNVDVPMTHETVDVERVPINQYLETAPPGVRYEGDTMIIPVLREEVVVTTRLLLVKEVRVTKRQTETQSPQQVTLRKEEITVERIPNSTATEFLHDSTSDGSASVNPDQKPHTGETTGLNPS